MPEARKFIAREIPLNGKLVTADDPAAIGASDFSVLQNMRYGTRNPRTVSGQTKINTSALANVQIRNVAQFHKTLPNAESHVLAWAQDANGANGKVYANDTAIPAQGAFGSSMFTDSSGAGNGRFSPAPNGALCYANGKDTAIWYGDEAYVRGFIDLDPAGTYKYDYTDAMISMSQESASLATIHNVAGTTTLLVGAPVPVSAFKVYVSTANAVAGTTTVKYWTGSAWTAVSSFTDGTAVAGKPLAQTGSWSFASTVGTAKPSVQSNVFLYWYQVTITNVAATTKLYAATFTAPMQQILDLWDGEYRPCEHALLYVTAATRYADVTGSLQSETYTDSVTPSVLLGGYPAGTDLKFGFAERQTAIVIRPVPTLENINAGTVTVKYWNGSAWTTVGTVTDGTSQGGKPLFDSGVISWTPPADEVEFKSAQQREELRYYYQITWSMDISANVRIYYTAGIPAQRKMGAYNFGFMHLNRLVLCGNKDKDAFSFDYSAYEQAQTFNGDDSDTVFLGDGGEIVGGASFYSRYGSTTQNLALLFKRSETWLWSGDSPTTFQYFPVSDKDGCVAPLSIATGSVELAPGVSKRVVFWLGHAGVFLSDGSSPVNVSADIADKFDPSRSTYLGSAVLSGAFGFIDTVYNEYHLILPNSAEYVFDIGLKRWFTFDRGTGARLACGCSVTSTDGTAYTYGAGLTGYLWRLENGSTFDGNAIASAMRLAAQSPDNNQVTQGTTLRYVKLVQKSKASGAAVSVTHYGDSSTSGTVLGTATPVATGKRLADRVLTANVRGPHVSHELELSQADTGFEPVFLCMYMDPSTRQDVR